MHYLTSSDIDEISHHLESEQINYSHLFEDLLDHICCEVESKMEEGENFNSAFNSIKHTIGNNGLKDIQDATIFYVKLNLLVMKKTIKILGIITSLLIIVGLFFKANHWPGASLLLTFGSLILLAGFAPISLISIKKEINKPFFSGQYLKYFIGAICLFTTALAILFKLMHWPGANYLIWLSWGLLLLVFFPILFFHIMRHMEKKLIPLTLLLFAFVIISMNVTQTLSSSVFFGNVYRYTVFDIDNEVTYYLNRNEGLLKEFQDTRSELPEVVVRQAEKFNSEIESVVTLNDNIRKEVLSGYSSLFELNSTYRRNTARIDNLIGDLKEHQIKINSVKDMAVKLVEGNEDIRSFVDIKLSTEVSDPYEGYHDKWFNLSYLWGSKVDIHNNLNKSKKDLLQVQYEILQEILSRKKS